MADTDLLVTYPALERHRAEQRSAKRSRLIQLGIAGPVLLAAVALLYSWSPPGALLVGAIGGMALFFAALPGASSVDAGQLAGVEGEIAALKGLSTLPEAYRILNRIRLPDPQLPNGSRELDFIVAGPTGLWVVEVKNTPGLVQVAPGERHWPLARRSGCSSCPSWNAMSNPEMQVRDQLDALRRWLLMNGIALQPRGAICLSHPEVAIRGADEAVYPVLIPDQLGERITKAGKEDLPAGLDSLLEALRFGRCSVSGTAEAKAS